MVPCIISSRIKRSGREAIHSLPSTVDVRKDWSFTFTVPDVFAAWCLINARDFKKVNQNTLGDFGPEACSQTRVTFQFVFIFCSELRTRTQIYILCSSCCSSSAAFCVLLYNTDFMNISAFGCLYEEWSVQKRARFREFMLKLKSFSHVRGRFDL
jgi:hypothetical protein